MNKAYKYLLPLTAVLLFLASCIGDTGIPVITGEAPDFARPYDVCESYIPDQDDDTLPPGSVSGLLTIYFIDVGQGDSTFIELPDGKTMLIDAGEPEQGGKVVSFIKSLGHSSVDYLTATHPHSDHIGGIPAVLKELDVRNVITTTDIGDSPAYTSYIEALGKSSAAVSYAEAGYVIFSHNDLTAEVVAPKTFLPDDINDNSIVIKLSFGENSFLFTADAQKAEEDSIWTNIKCDLLKVGHHGSESSTSRNFLKKVEPEYAVISCGADNPYGHPHDSVLARLFLNDIKVFRTDLQGTITVTSDGKSITINKEPLPYSPAALNDETNNEVSRTDIYLYDYVLNTHTMKIHYASCPSVTDIKEKNKLFTNDYEGAIAQGYTPCGRCSPKK